MQGSHVSQLPNNPARLGRGKSKYSKVVMRNSWPLRFEAIVLNSENSKADAGTVNRSGIKESKWPTRRSVISAKESRQKLDFFRSPVVHPRFPPLPSKRMGCNSSARKSSCVAVDYASVCQPASTPVSFL